MIELGSAPRSLTSTLSPTQPIRNFARGAKGLHASIDKYVSLGKGIGNAGPTHGIISVMLKIKPGFIRL